MALDAADLDPRQAPRPAEDVRGGGDVHAELVVAQAGRDVRMGARVDVGVDAQGHPHRPARGRRGGGDPRDLGLALRVELADAPLDAQRDLRVALADAREDDPVRGEAGAQRGAELAAGHDVRPRAEAGEDLQQGVGAVGLERVADAMGHAAERAVVGAVRLLDRGAAVDEQRRAVLERGGLEGNAVARQHAVLPLERAGRRFGHAAGLRSESRSAAAATPLRPMTPTRLGKICRPFIRSPQAQTSSTLLMAPKTISPQ